MADLLDNCRFLAGSMGTADFADGAADPTFRNLEDAGAEDGKTYPYKAQNATGTEWEIGRGMALNTSGGWILERTSIQDSSNGGSLVNFGTAPKVIITAGREEFGAETITYDPADSGLSATDVQGAVDELAGLPFYLPSNILGTVSQAGGVPTGAIIERGSNANGAYVRYADGTQICWALNIAVGVNPTTATGQVFISGGIVWTFPAAFVDGNVVVNHAPRRTSGNGTGWAAQTSGTIPTSTNSHQLSVAASTNTWVGAVDAMAIGRWF